MFGIFGTDNLISYDIGFHMYNRSNTHIHTKKKRNTSFYVNTNYRTEMKPVPIKMDYCLLQFDASNFFLGIRLHGKSQPNFNFFNVNYKVFQ